MSELWEQAMQLPPLGEFQSTGIAREAAHPSVNATEAQKKATLMPLSR